MHANWLIRTADNQIIGPMPREKVIELLDNQTLLDNDELCSGNGFWFSVREKELLELYLLKDEFQVFNPVSEPTSVLCEEQFCNLVVRKKKKKKKKGKKQDENPIDVKKLKNEAEKLFSYINDETLRQTSISTFIKSKEKFIKKKL